MAMDTRRLASRLALAGALSLASQAAWAEAPPASAPVPPPAIDPTTEAVLQGIDRQWQDKLDDCLSQNEKLPRKLVKPCRKLYAAVARASQVRAEVHAHVFGRIERILWMRAGILRRSEAAASIDSSLRAALPTTWRDLPTVPSLEAQYLLTTLSDPDVRPHQREVVAELAGWRLQVDVCAKPPWLGQAHSPPCGPPWEAWLRQFAQQSPPQWQAWEKAQLRPRLQSTDWTLRYQGVRAWAATKQPLEKDGDVLRVVRSLILHRRLSADLVATFSGLLEPATVRAALYPPDEPGADWGWAKTPLAALPPGVVPIVRGPVPNLTAPELPAAKKAHLLKLYDRLQGIARDCDQAFASLGDAEDRGDTGPAWCHTDQANVARAAGSELAAHLVGAWILAGNEVPQLNLEEDLPVDYISQGERAVRDVCDAADRRVLQSYMAHLLQRHLERAPTLTKAAWLAEQEQLLGWATAIGDVSLCAGGEADAACEQQWLAWLYAASQLDDTNFAQATEAELAVRLRSADGMTAALAILDLQPRVSAGARSTTARLRGVHELAPWVWRNWLLDKSTPSAVLQRLDPPQRVARLAARLYPEDDATLGLQAVDLTGPPSKR